MIIIPDIHGRSFWKTAVKQASAGETIIFLGDYLDPYPQERIKIEDAIDNFKEIMQFKDENFENVILLLGNHDWHYINHSLCGGRMANYATAKQIKEMIENNKHLFSFIYHTEINNKIYLFSHAGMMRKWIDVEYYPIYDNRDYQKLLNKIEQDFISESLHDFSSKLTEISYYRGGMHEFGSPIWADANEQKYNDIPDNIYQIFGHTQLYTEHIDENYACLDCRDAFRLDESSGKITKITDEDYMKHK